MSDFETPPGLAAVVAAAFAAAFAAFAALTIYLLWRGYTESSFWFGVVGTIALIVTVTLTTPLWMWISDSIDDRRRRRADLERKSDK